MNMSNIIVYPTMKLSDRNELDRLETEGHSPWYTGDDIDHPKPELGTVGTFLEACDEDGTWGSWLAYLIEHFFAPRGYKLEGMASSDNTSSNWGAGIVTVNERQEVFETFVDFHAVLYEASKDPSQLKRVLGDRVK